MRRLITLAIACITAVALSGCIVVPRHGYYNDHHDSRGHDHGGRGDHRGR